jgi:TonB family protein
MKILTAGILIFFAFVFAQAQTSAPLSAALQEADKLNVEMIKLFKAKKYDEALPLAKKVLEIREKESGKTHVSVAQAWRNLAYVEQQRGKSKEAEKAFENALEIYEKVQPLSTADEKLIAELLEVVATYQANEGDFDKAQGKIERALELSEKTNGKDSLETGRILLKLAQIYEFKLQYEKAAPLLLRSLAIKISKLGRENDETRFAYSNAFCALTKTGKLEEAKNLSADFDPPLTEFGRKISKIETIKGGVVNGKALSLPKPPYPMEARAKRASGAVQVQVTIDQTGQVIFACAIKGAKELQRASEIAAYNSKFAPTQLGGKPVRVSGVIVYNFVP